MFLVDAHVGKALFTDAIVGGLKARGKTVILVTHALHFLSQCDYIYTISNGQIAEQGTYDTLINLDGEFSRLAKEFGGEQKQEDEEEAIEEEDEVDTKAKQKAAAVDKAKLKAKIDLDKVAGKGRLEGRLMVKEQRTTGAVSWQGRVFRVKINLVFMANAFQVYGAYLKAGKGWITLPFVLATMIVMQVSSVLNSYTLVWWEGK